MGRNFARPSKNRKLPNVFNKKQLINLFEVIDNPHIFVGSLIALFCGLRISEVCNLKKQDIDLESEKVIIREGKGSKDRVVMLPNCLVPLLEKWFRLTKENEYVVFTEYNNRYFTNVFSNKFKRCLEKAKMII